MSAAGVGGEQPHEKRGSYEKRGSCVRISERTWASSHQKVSGGLVGGSRTCHPQGVMQVLLATVECGLELWVVHTAMSCEMGGGAGSA